MKRNLIALFLAALMLFSVSACSSGETEDAATTPPASSEPAAPSQTVPEEEPQPTEVTITDQAGREVTVGEVNSTVICWYMANDFVLALDKADTLIAIGPYDDFQALVAPRLTELDTAGRGKPDLEKLASLNPDLFIHRVSDPENLEACDELGITAIAIAPETAEETMDALRIIGQALGASERAEMLIDYYDSIVDIAKAGTANVPEDEKHTFLILGSDIGYVASDAMMQAQMIDLGGGINMAADVTDSNSWTDIGTEQIFAYDPEFLFISSTANFTVDDIMNDPAWADLTAVKNGNVYAVPSTLHAWENLGLSPCIGSVWAMSVMYPESITQEKLDEIVTDFYKTVYNLDVDREFLGY